MDDNRHGQVITFYSFKGGTGRTMALANVAWILAAAGHKVLVADWDLESPGLHQFFRPFIDPDVFDDQPGVIDLIREYEDESAQQHPSRPPTWHEEQAQACRYAVPLNIAFESGGELHFLSSGRQNQDYRVSVGGLDWDTFFESRGGDLFFVALRASMKRDFDYALIDSRTGLSDFADICTLHLPDVLVDCFTLSEQGIDGAAKTARRVAEDYRSRNIRVLPVPMRVDYLAEKAKVDAGRVVAQRRFVSFPAHLEESERPRYWSDVEVPYSAFYAFEETLATVGDRPGSLNSLLASYERLTGYLTDGKVTRMPALEEPERRRLLERYKRQTNVQEDEVTLRYAPQDQIWAEWIEQLLLLVGVRVNDPWRRPADEQGPGARTLTLLSTHSVGKDVGVLPHDHGARQPLAVYLSDLPAVPGYPPATSAHLHGQQHEGAVESVLRLVGRQTDAPAKQALDRAARFPSAAPLIFEAPSRNLRFTGRADELQELRKQLVEAGGTQPVVLHGMGGIGKTQMAVEYVYRFRLAYDVVWWINSDPPQFIDASLIDLGGRMRLPGQQRALETPRSVLNALSPAATPYRRWLLVLDNADDIEHVRAFLPEGPGHVLITSRNHDWREVTSAFMTVDVFARRESIAMLRRRLESLSTHDADRVAVALGDLPIAISAASAWLADTGTPVEQYLQQILVDGPAALSTDPESSKPVQMTWDLSLDGLAQRSPGAYRLLQLCSVLAPEIASDLIHSDEMGDALRPTDPRAAERMERGRLVQDINRLALLKLDARSGIQVHRLLQRVVQDRMDAEDLAATRHAVHKILASARPRGDVDDPANSDGFRKLWPHLEVSEAMTCADEDVRELLVERVRYLWLRSAYKQGEEVALRIQAQWTTLMETFAPGSDERRTLHRQTLSLQFTLANILREQGRFEESRALDERVLAEQRQLLGPDSPYILITAGGLAADHRTLGNYEEALRLDRATHAGWASAFGDDYPRSLAAQNNLATSLRLSGNFREARRHDEEAFSRRRVVLGANNNYTLHSASMLGRDLRESGEYERSVDLLTDVLASARKHLGDDARTTLNVQVNLAVSLRSAGRAGDAGELLDTAYERLLDAYGADNPDTLACRLSRAANIHAVGDFELAKQELEGVHRAYRDRLGEHHPHTIACLNNLAAVERTSGDRSEALKLAEDAAVRFARLLPETHPYVLAARMNVVICAAEAHTDPDIPGGLGALLEQFRQVLGPEHPDTLRCEANLVLVQGAAVDETSVLTRLRHRLGDTHPAVVAFEERRFLHRVLDPHPY